MTIIKAKNWLQQNWPLKYRALCLALFISLSASLLVGLTITRSSIEQLEQQSLQMRNTLSKQVSIQASEAIFSQDLLSLNVILATLVKDPLIRYGAVYNLNNEIMAEQGLADTDQGQPLSIRYQDEVIGLLEIRLDRTQLDQAIARLYGLWFVLSSLVCIVGSIIGWASGRYLGRKLEQSHKQIMRLGESDLQISTHNLGELKPLTSALAVHHQQLIDQAAVSQALNQFINTETPLHEQLDSAGQYSHAAILFINLENLAEVQNQLSASALTTLLNDYYSLINQAADLYSGHVDRYQGRGVMVLFGLPNKDQKDCFHGVCTALLLLGLFKEFNQARIHKELPVIDFQLGLHAGTVLTTPVDIDVLDNQPLSMAMGETHHIAARLARKAQPHRLLISEDVMQHGQLAGQLIINKHGMIKGSSQQQQIETFWVEYLTPNYQALIDRQIQHISRPSPKLAH